MGSTISAPDAFNRIVLTVIGRIVGKLQVDLLLVGKGH